MAYLSPQVEVNETDNTQTTVQVGTSMGMTVITAGWGPVNDPQLLTGENDLVAIFGKPNSKNFKSWFTAANFMDYTAQMYVVRASTKAQRNASVKAEEEHDLVINNETEYTAQYENGIGDYGQFCAKYPGAIGNSIMVTYADAGSFENWKWTDANGKQYDFRQEFSDAPSTSNFVKQRDGKNDELHLLVVDAGGRITGTKGTVLERYEYLSKASDGKTLDGTSNFYKTVLRDRSAYVYWMDYPEESLLNREIGFEESAIVGKAKTGETILQKPIVANGNFGDEATDTIFPNLKTPYFGRMQGGVDSFEADDGELMQAYDLFKNKEEFDISLIPTGAASATVSKYVIQSLCEHRLDCVACVSPNDGHGNPILGLDLLDDTIKFRTNSDFNVNTSYAFLDSGWKYQYDKYNDTYRWIPLSGDTAGLMARTDATNASWWSPAGYTRGQYKNVVKLNFSPNKTQRDQLYQKGINPVVTFRGEGTVLYGDKTLLTKPSAFDRINVRRLFIYLEKVLSESAKYQLFEFNDSITRAYARSLVEPVLRQVQGARGIQNWKVICDDSNNTADIINANRFIMDIYVQPNYSINFITLNFIAEKSGSAVFAETTA